MDIQSKPGPPLDSSLIVSEVQSGGSSSASLGLPRKISIPEFERPFLEESYEISKSESLFNDLSIFDDVDNKMKQNLDNELVQTALDQVGLAFACVFVDFNSLRTGN